MAMPEEFGDADDMLDQFKNGDFAIERASFFVVLPL